MTDLTHLTALEQAKLIRDRKVSAVELLDATLAQVRKVDGRPGQVGATETAEDLEKVHAFILLTEREAREKAAEVDRRIAAGEAVGPLAGVPYSAKDVFCTKGIQTTAAAKILDGWKPPYNSTVIEKMDQADAVLFGKVNLDEFTFGGSNETTAFKPTVRNPWDFTRVPGGSSGGSAAAVAADEGAISLGTDTGGSIREPAAFTGTVGLKPTYGRVSRYGVIPFASSMDTIGPLARSVADAAIVLREISGADPKDGVTGRVAIDDYLAEMVKGVKGMRIGISPDYLEITHIDANGEYAGAPIDSDVLSTFNQAVEIFRALGAEIIEDVPMKNTKYSVPAYFAISRIEAYSNLQRYDGLRFGVPTKRSVADMYDLYYKTRGEGFGYQTKLRLLTGIFISQEKFYEKYYRRAQQARGLLRADFDHAFDPDGKYRLDVLLTPSTPSPAFEFGGATAKDSLLMQFADQFTSPMNFAGTPGISFPAGLSKEGLPIGLQAAGYDYCESKILRAAYAFERATADEEWRSVKPMALR